MKARMKEMVWDSSSGCRTHAFIVAALSFFSYALAFMHIPPQAEAAHSCIFPEFSHRKEDAIRWLDSRLKNLPHNNIINKKWPTQGKFRLQSSNANSEELSQEEINNYMHRVGHLNTEKKAIGFVQLDALGRFQAKGEYGWTLLTEQELKSGTTLMSFSLEKCMSDEVASYDPVSLVGSPWEIRLATKLLRERAEGISSPWSTYIKSLPRFIPLPIFFSESELRNLQDTSITDEVVYIRRFLIKAFQALHHKEKAGAKFSEFAWAVSVVYSSACKTHQASKHEISPSKYLLVPILSYIPASRSSLASHFWSISNGTMSFLVNYVKKGTLLATRVEPDSAINAFLFQGMVPKGKPQDQAKIFKDVEELVDWYSSTFSAVNNNRYLTFKLVKDAIDTLRKRMPSKSSFASHASTEILSVGAEGYVDPNLVCAFATLYSAKELIQLSSSSVVDEVGFFLRDFDKREGSYWETMLLRLVNDSLSVNIRNLLLPELSGGSPEKQALKFAAEVIQQRISLILESYSTSLLEDKLLLRSVTQESLSPDLKDQACPNCQWPTEELSGCDYITVKFRVHQKIILQGALSSFTNVTGIHPSEVSTFLGQTEEESSASLEKLLKWCRDHEFEISEKLTMGYINTGVKEHFSEEHIPLVRGIFANEDINHGETLCILNIAAGLYDNVSSSGIEVDDWDLAAALLLREKALGDSSRWAPYIAVLPTKMPSPITMQPYELEEVQWLPALRELIQIRQAIKESYHSLNMKDLGGASFKEYEWAATMVHSRAFTLPVLEEEKYSHYVMMPYMDMINHHFLYQADWTSQPIVDGKLEIIARRSLKKGEQLFASFGPRSNDNLFLYYGFILDNNPFDSAKIFASFDDVVRWFLRVWTTDSIDLSQNATYELCDFLTWQKLLPTVLTASEDFSSSESSQNKEWWELVGKWSEYGSQYFSYQPNPTVYASGVVDPSLLRAFISIANVTILSSKWNVQNPKCEAVECKSNISSASYMKKFFRCLENLGDPFYRPLLHQHDCQSFLASVWRAEEQRRRAVLAARISVALRCLELLASLPTTIAQDRLLLKNFKDSGDSVSPSVYLARRYRYSKKLLLRSAIDRVLTF